MRMPELKALARESRLRNYSWLRKADLIAFLWDMNRDDRGLLPHPHRCPLGNQIEVLLGNQNMNHKLKPDNPPN